MAWPPVELLHLGPENNETKKAINAKIKFFFLEMHMMLFSIFETLALAQRSEECRGHHHWLWHKGPRTAEAITIVLTISCFSQYAHPGAPNPFAQVFSSLPRKPQNGAKACLVNLSETWLICLIRRTPHAQESKSPKTTKRLLSFWGGNWQTRSKLLIQRP